MCALDFVGASVVFALTRLPPLPQHHLRIYIFQLQAAQKQREQVAIQQRMQAQQQAKQQGGGTAAAGQQQQQQQQATVQPSVNLLETAIPTAADQANDMFGNMVMAGSALGGSGGGGDLLGMNIMDSGSGISIGIGGGATAAGGAPGDLLGMSGLGMGGLGSGDMMAGGDMGGGSMGSGYGSGASMGAGQQLDMLGLMGGSGAMGGGMMSGLGGMGLAPAGESTGFARRENTGQDAAGGGYGGFGGFFG